MALTTYGELKTSIADWLDREDLTGNIPSFVRLAEADIYRDLRCRQNEFHAVYTPTEWFIEGVSQGVPVNGAHKQLPQNYKEMKLVTFSGQPLREVSEQHIRERIRINEDRTVIYFAEFARQVIFSVDIPDDFSEWSEGQELTYTYYGVESLDGFPSWQTAMNPVDNPVVQDNRPEALVQTESNTTRLLQHAPDLYLSGSMVWAYRYLMQPQKVAEWLPQFQMARAALDIESQELTGSTVSVSSTYGDGERRYAY